jgi:membrane associated rhomboid family serine protease
VGFAPPPAGAVLLCFAGFSSAGLAVGLVSVTLSFGVSAAAVAAGVAAVLLVFLCRRRERLFLAA